MLTNYVYNDNGYNVDNNELRLEIEVRKEKTNNKHCAYNQKINIHRTIIIK